MHWTYETHGTFSSQHQQKSHKQQSAELALCEKASELPAPPPHTDERRG